MAITISTGPHSVIVPNRRRRPGQWRDERRPEPTETRPAGLSVAMGDKLFQAGANQGSGNRTLGLMADDLLPVQQGGGATAALKTAGGAWRGWGRQPPIRRTSLHLHPITRLLECISGAVDGGLVKMLADQHH